MSGRKTEAIGGRRAFALPRSSGVQIWIEEVSAIIRFGSKQVGDMSSAQICRRLAASIDANDPVVRSWDQWAIGARGRSVSRPAVFSTGKNASNFAIRADNSDSCPASCSRGMAFAALQLSLL
jgi:hypothetical protein